MLLTDQILPPISEQVKAT